MIASDSPPTSSIDASPYMYTCMQKDTFSWSSCVVTEDDLDIL